jgi:hypothetical protein
MLIIFWYPIAGVCVGQAASERGRGFFNWMIGSWFLTPLFSVLLLLAFPPIPGKSKYRAAVLEEPSGRY